MVLTINTNLIDQPVAIDTYQFDEFVVGYDSYMNNGATEHELNYLKGEIVNGEFMICVNAVDTGLEQCAWGYDGPEKKPEYVTVDLYSNGTPQPLNNGNSQSQSQSSSNNNENENNNVQSQSQETTIIICNDGKCKP